jgi:quercetin dioxygenase-like cupin family protein
VSPVEQLCSDFDAAVDELKSQGFRIDLIYPADEPHTAVLTRGGESVRLTSRAGAPQPPEMLPAFHPEFVLTHGGAAAAGRAGMLYRDLVPSRLGGRYIASHITIAEGGPVPDWVHFHRVAVQVIAVRRGWVRVVYEDQGEPFVMRPGDLVLQPPGIRHRVLESSPGLEVVELTCPAVHATYGDHALDLPTKDIAADRTFGGQRFLWHRAAGAPWTELAGGEAQETGLDAATGGLAEARIVRPGRSSRLTFDAHDGELSFGFLLEGSARLERGEGTFDLAPAAAFVIPPDESWSLDRLSADFRLLQLTTARIDENCLAAGARSPL